jgi:hypothetical protein
MMSRVDTFASCYHRNLATSSATACGPFFALVPNVLYTSLLRSGVCEPHASISQLTDHLLQHQRHAFGLAFERLVNHQIRRAQGAYAHRPLSLYRWRKGQG